MFIRGYVDNEFLIASNKSVQLDMLKMAKDFEKVEQYDFNKRMIFDPVKFEKSNLKASIFHENKIF